MLTIGQELYSPTLRDLQTLQLEPFNRAIGSQIPAAQVSGSVDILVPADRAMWLHAFTLLGQPTALSTWQQFSFALLDRGGNVLPSGLVVFGGVGCTLQGDNCGAGVAGAAVAINRLSGIVIPPSVSALRLTASRAVTTNPADFVLAVTGYLIPPGGIGRV